MFLTNLFPRTFKGSVALLCLLVQTKIATQIAKVNSAISWRRYGGQAVAAYRGLAPQYAAVLGYVGGAVTGGVSFGTALGSLGRPLMTLADGAAALASSELVAMTNATVTGIAQIAAPIWTPVTDTIESMDYTHDDLGGPMQFLWMGPVLLSMGMKSFGKVSMGTAAHGQIV